MKECPQGCEFYFCDGVCVNNVDDLVNHIKDLSPEQYEHHVNDERNDFYNWIKDCLDPKLSAKIAGKLDKETLVSKLKPAKKTAPKKKK